MKCSAHKTLKTGGELSCDLDAGHEVILSFHYDKLEDVEWRANHQPQAVAYAPTGPMKKLQVERQR